MTVQTTTVETPAEVPETLRVECSNCRGKGYKEYRVPDSWRPVLAKLDALWFYRKENQLDTSRTREGKEALRANTVKVAKVLQEATTVNLPQELIAHQLGISLAHVHNLIKAGKKGA